MDEQKAEFIAQMRALMTYMSDSFIRANVEDALNRMETDRKLKKYKFVRDPRNVCTHDVSLSDDCENCAESYGGARTVAGEYVEDGTR